VNIQEFIDMLFIPQTEEFHCSVDEWYKFCVVETMKGVGYVALLYTFCYFGVSA